MDWDSLALLQDLCPPGHQKKLRRLTEFCRMSDSPVVPGPCYDGSAGFGHVLDLVEDACDGLILHIHKRGKQCNLGQQPFMSFAIVPNAEISKPWLNISSASNTDHSVEFGKFLSHELLQLLKPKRRQRSPVHKVFWCL